jgi:Zn-dependent peptidase ImmA (M78 family)
VLPIPAAQTIENSIEFISMERIRQINPDRIRWCSDDFGISLEELPQQLHIAPDRLKGVLDGHDGLTFSQLRSMADFFGRGVLFFLETGKVTDASMRTAEFRSLSNEQPDLSPSEKRLIERAERHRDLYLSLIDDVGGDPIPKFNPPIDTNITPNIAAQNAREWLRLSNDPNLKQDFTAYREAVESRGVVVLRSMGYAGAWQFPKDSPVIGFSLYFDLCPLIVVRKELSEARQTFTLMHELGHLLLHRRSTIDIESNFSMLQGREREANVFAGNLLVPANFISRIQGNTPDDISMYDGWLANFRNTWGVSTEVILRRLLDTRRIGSAQYAGYREWKAKQPNSPRTEGGSRWRDREPLHIFGKRYVRTVLDALSSDRITLNKASSYLDNLKIADVRKLEKHIAGV